MDNKYGDAVTISPDVHKVILENDKVRVLGVVLEPGVTAKMHWHPASVIHVIEGGWIEITNLGEEPKKIEFKKGGTVYRDITTHEVKNVGDTTIEALHIELKS